MNTNLRENEPPVDRREREEVIHDRDGARRTRVVEDVAAERSAVAGRLAQFVWLLTGIVEFLIGLRVILKLMAANAEAPFVSMIYNVTDLFLWPFFGITGTPAANGMVLEISSLLAMLVYAALGWVLAELLRLLLTPASSRTTTVEHHHDL